jgi:ABC-type oligopeptide transport system ATPase subunit
MTPASLLTVDSLCVDFGKGHGRIRVLDGVTLDVGARETVGLVGESGSGKSTLGNAILGLVDVSAGSIEFDGEEIAHLNAKRRRELTKQIQVIYQDPYGSLNPARTIGSTLAEPLTARSRGVRGGEVETRVNSALEMVGLPQSAWYRYPGDFSGGQRQRIAIARAIVVRPRLVVCDEAVSALDLSIQAQVLNLLEDLRAEMDMSYLFISHDLTVVGHVSSRVAVMYRGAIVEFGDADKISDSPEDPYTAMLLSASPVPDPIEQRNRRTLFLQRSRELAAKSGQRRQ